MEVLTLASLKTEHRLEPVMVRLPKWALERAEVIAKEQSEKGTKVTVTDVYRSAILFFLNENSTDSRVKPSEAQPA